jgi:hypothetical protein
VSTALRITWLASILGFAAANAEDRDLQLPLEIPTYADGRMPVRELFRIYLTLVDMGWHLDVIATSQPTATTYALPIIALRSPKTGPAVWILSGIHGEEPAGPNAVAAAIEDLAKLGDHHPVVLIPLCNPHGYARNWRYLNVPVYSDIVEGQSVGDSSHLLADEKDATKSRAAAASSPEADALTHYVLQMKDEYPPLYSIDLHEDNLINEGYVYSQGELGARDPLAIEAVNVLRENSVPIKISGQTRFGEEIVGGIIGPVIDSSIDEFMSAADIVVDGRPQTGPHARTVLVFETPAKALTFEQRKAAHFALIRRLIQTIH